MRLLVAAVGRLKSGPERDLSARYAERVTAGARALGLRMTDVAEIDESRARDGDTRKREEAAAIRRVAEGRLILFDERGRSIDSGVFARLVAGWRDAGQSAATFVIGGPDGLDAELRAEADLVMSFGGMTIPHQLVRVLVLEQLYRMTTILAGHPYHRA